MSSEHAAEAGESSSRMQVILSEWYARNPDIRRLWIYAARETDPDHARAFHVVVALAPVCDSDDTSPIWLARCAGWHRHLQGLIGHGVQLHWFDAGTDAVPCEEDPEHGRVCLASIAWRY